MPAKPTPPRPRRRREQYRRTAVKARGDIMDAIADLKEDIALNTYETAAVHTRLDAIEPTLTTLEQERQRRIGVARFLAGGRIWFAFIGAALAYVAQAVATGRLPPSLPPHAP